MTRSQAFNPIRAAESAWRILMKAPLPMWLGGFLLMLVGGMGGGGGSGMNVQGQGHMDPEFLWVLVPVAGIGCLFGLVMFAAGSWLMVGFCNSVRTVMRTGTVELEEVFDARGRWWQMILVRIVQLLLGAAAVIPFFIPVLIGMIVSDGLDLADEVGAGIALLGVILYIPVLIYVHLGLMFMPYAAAFEDLTISQALDRSWALARGNRLQLIVFCLGSVVIALVGLMLCCVGIIPASIVIEVMWIEAYIQATDIAGDPEDWWIEDQNSYEPRPPRRTPPTGPAPFPDASAQGPRDVEAEVQSPPPEGPQVASDEPFDPGRWRGEADIPPIEDDESGEGPKA